MKPKIPALLLAHRLSATAPTKSARRPASARSIHHSALISDTQRFLDEGFDLAQDTPVEDEQLHKILGGNFLRGMRQVEAVSRQLQSSPEPSHGD